MVAWRIRSRKGAPERSGARVLRVEAAQLHRIGHALDREQVGGGPHVDLVPLGDGQGLAERLDHEPAGGNCFQKAFLLQSEIIRGKVAVQRAYADWRRYPQYIVPLSESSIDLIFAPLQLAAIGLTIGLSEIRRKDGAPIDTDQ